MVVTQLAPEGGKTLAQESEKTQKARRKLRQRLDTIDAKITPKAIEQKAMEIHRWIARHAPNRVVLRTKTISLFDGNKNTAEISQKISRIAMTLKSVKKSLE